MRSESIRSLTTYLSLLLSLVALVFSLLAWQASATEDVVLGESVAQYGTGRAAAIQSGAEGTRTPDPAQRGQDRATPPDGPRLGSPQSLVSQIPVLRKEIAFLQDEVAALRSQAMTSNAARARSFLKWLHEQYRTRLREARTRGAQTVVLESLSALLPRTSQLRGQGAGPGPGVGADVLRDGVVLCDGYCFRLAAFDRESGGMKYMPGGDGAFSVELASGGAATPIYVIYAWPFVYQYTGHRAFAVDSDSRMLVNEQREFTGALGSPKPGSAVVRADSRGAVNSWKPYRAR